MSRAPLDLALDVIAETALPPGLDVTGWDALACFVLEAEGASGPWDVAVALVGDDRLQELHRDFMGIDEPTDVMTFPAEEPGRHGGDIAVSVDRAGEQGPEHGATAAEETTFLFVHGLLHLAGWRDEDPEDRSRMLARQGELVEGFRG